MGASSGTEFWQITLKWLEFYQQNTAGEPFATRKASIWENYVARRVHTVVLGVKSRDFLQIQPNRCFMMLPYASYFQRCEMMFRRHRFGKWPCINNRLQQVTCNKNLSHSTAHPTNQLFSLPKNTRAASIHSATNLHLDGGRGFSSSKMMTQKF